MQVIKEPYQANRSRVAGFPAAYPGDGSEILIPMSGIPASAAGSMKTPTLFRVQRGDTKSRSPITELLRIHIPSCDDSRFKPAGDTDSERAFCHLLNRSGGNLQEDPDMDRLAGELGWLNDQGRFNRLLSGGRHLMCYHDQNARTGLTFVRRLAPFDTVGLRDEDWAVDLREEKGPGQDRYIIVNQPLTEQAWGPFHPGEMLIIRSGRLIYSNRRSPISDLTPKSQEPPQSGPRDLAAGRD